MDAAVAMQNFRPQHIGSSDSAWPPPQPRRLPVSSCHRWRSPHRRWSAWICTPRCRTPDHPCRDNYLIQAFLRVRRLSVVLPKIPLSPVHVDVFAVGEAPAAEEAAFQERALTRGKMGRRWRWSRQVGLADDLGPFLEAGGGLGLQHDAQARHLRPWVWAGEWGVAEI